MALHNEVRKSDGWHAVLRPIPQIRGEHFLVEVRQLKAAINYEHGNLTAAARLLKITESQAKNIRRKAQEREEW